MMPSVHEINIWPDFNELLPEQQEALRKYYALSLEDQTGLGWASREHESRVAKALNSLAEQLREQYR